MKKITLIALFAAFGASAQNQQPQVTMPIIAEIPFQGYDEAAAYLGEGEYEIFTDYADGVLDKPIILVDGFDPNDARSVPMIYDLLNYGTDQNLANDLRDLGYDVVILNFPNYTRTGTETFVSGGSDFIQRNAMVLVELLNQINSDKVGDEQNVVIGPSMGGLVARYALRYMEMNSLEHDTRLYVSFDAPHKGANIPIGFQHLFNYMAYGPLADATLQIVVDAMLRSTASSQMLIDHFEGHLQAGSETEFNNSITLPTGKPGFRAPFQTELDAMGLPQDSRNIAIANGSGNAAMNGSPGMVVMDHTFNITDTERAIINLKFTPDAGQTTQVSRFRGQTLLFGFWVTVFESMANSQAPAVSSGLDSAPGSRFDMTSLADMAGTNALLTEFFDNLAIDYFTFVPTLSALGIDNPNWYAPVTGATSTPFDATFVPDVNEDHVTLTAANLAFVLNEILNPVMGTPENSIAGLQVLNPVSETINLMSAELLSAASLKICDLTGKQVYEANNLNIHGFFPVDVSLESGIYFLTISSEGRSITKKIITN